MFVFVIVLIYLFVRFPAFMFLAMTFLGLAASFVYFHFEVYPMLH